MKYLPLKRMAPLALALLAGCAFMPKDDAVLPQRDIASAELPKHIKLAREGWPEARWWTAYRDPQLDALMNAAIKDAPSLATAEARLKSARAALLQQRAADGITVDFNAQVDRQYISATGLFPPPIGGEWYTEGKVGFNGNWDFDFWGKNRARVAATLGEANARLAESASAEQALAAAVTQSYFNLQADWARQANFARERQTQAELAATRKKLVAQGLAAIDTQKRVEADVAATEQKIAALDSAAVREREALRALVGGDAVVDGLKPQALPQGVGGLPKTLGIELLARRPDLQAARWRVEASMNQIDAAKAAYYPTVNLNLFAGFDTISMSDLFDRGSRQINLIPNFTLPIFENGRLDAQLHGANAQRSAAIADYNQSVLNAVRDVAQGAAAVQGIEREGDALKRNRAATDAVYASTQKRFKQGLTDRGSLLAAELPLRGLDDQTLQLQSQRLIADVALIKALGGGYRADPGSSTEQAHVEQQKN
ncbi:efflux transporter outer membrane subunit [Jeongeupia naejangsanensis]|uniref:Efflux transporter outer membrane subunit n=1 Tax=Jeongeupia naejangsanensis TaxID=613195 RepID=A0ABS2BL02_9NEIS|nr:efflux transporter outer membrane subunit [Jeongeupia naejangsanensis]MBM3115748.1 efflux transporter outer membrane subunit [Jeongeupia naejangsanensis]